MTSFNAHRLKMQRQQIERYWSGWQASAPAAPTSAPLLLPRYDYRDVLHRWERLTGRKSWQLETLDAMRLRVHCDKIARRLNEIAEKTQ